MTEVKKKTRTRKPNTKGKVNLKKVKEQKTKEKNVEAVKDKITEKKDLKYIYPSDVSTLQSRKKFRHKIRQIRDRYLKKIAKAENDAEKGKILKEAKTWAKTVFTGKGMPKELVS